MDRRRALQTIAAGFPAILHGARRRAGDKPNLLFQWTDEQRAETLSVYGNHRFHIPTLNRLASESVVFDRYYDDERAGVQAGWVVVRRLRKQMAAWQRRTREPQSVAAGQHLD